MTDSHDVPAMGWGAFTTAFEQYWEASNTYLDAQEAALDGLKESANALEHYSHAYELWLDAWQQTVTTDSQSDAHEEETQYPTSIPLEPVRQSSPSTSTDPSESNRILRERVATLEQRQQALEETLNEIHREVVE